MSATTFGTDSYKWRLTNGTIKDPGAGGTIPVNVDGGYCPLVSAAAETRFLGTNDGGESKVGTCPYGVEVTLEMVTDGGDIVVEFYTSVDGTNDTVTFNSVGDWAKFIALPRGWSLLASGGIAVG